MNFGFTYIPQFSGELAFSARIPVLVRFCYYLSRACHPGVTTMACHEVP